MATTKATNETQGKAPSAPVVAQQPETPEKMGGPGQVARMAESSAAPPNGASSSARGEMLPSGTSAPGAAPRAQMMRNMQRSVGNARLGRMFARTPESPKEENKEPAKPPANGNRIQTLAVSHPDDPSEKEAEAVAHRVVSGQSAGAAPVSRLASGVTSAVARMTGDEKGSAEHKEPTPSVPAQPEGKPEHAMGIAQRVEAGDKAQTNAPAAADAISNKGAGSPISRSMRNSIEPHLGADLSGARVHHDNAADEAASAINARAFTHGSDIFLARGESENNTHLMAHEATHVVQQSSAAPETASSLHRKAAAPTAPTTPKSGKGAGGKPAVDLPVAPGVLDLKDMKNDFKPPPLIDKALEEQKGKEVIVQTTFGKIAEGELKVSKVKDKYKVKRQPLTLNHPLFKQVEGETGGIMLRLFVSVDNKNQIVGFIGIGDKADSPDDLDRAIKRAPDLIGLAGLQVPELKLTNTLRDGRLELGAENIGFTVGRILKGQVSLQVIDENIGKLAGTAQVSATGLAKGEVKLERNKDGLVTGQGHIDLDLKKGKFTGGVDVIWDGRAVTGEGKVGYSGEKLSGEVTLRLMEKGAAAQSEKEKKAPPEETGKAPAATTTKDSGKPKNVDYVVFGEGDLTFAFNDWLNGTAHVIVDREGFVTIIGKITPQKEFPLFDVKPFNETLFKVEARATYGVPLLADIFVFANVSLDAFATIGPAKFYNIVVEGTYSTNPAENKDFSIKGSINISAEAGLRLRAEAGAGLEVLGHDIKLGAGITGTAGIKAYAEATPVIGYREKGAPGEDKKGEFYIRGDLEIAAQPFLGLSGDLFVELETPWWSPLSDHKWTWPLFDKEYPIGGSMGMLASVDYVFGSGQWPSFELKPIEFDPHKFVPGVLEDKTQPKSAAAEEKKGDWKEKNEGAPEPPKPVEGKGNAKKGKLPEQPTPKPKVQPGGPKGPEKHVDDKAKLGGKSIEEHKKEALEKNKKDAVPEPKGAKVKDKAEDKEKEGKGKVEQDPAKKWERGVTVVTQALQYAEKEGIELAELNKILSKIQKRPEYGFTSLYAVPDEGEWVVMGSMSAAKKVTKIKKKKVDKAVPYKDLLGKQVVTRTEAGDTLIPGTKVEGYIIQVRGKNANIRPESSKAGLPDLYIDAEGKLTDKPPADKRKRDLEEISKDYGVIALNLEVTLAEPKWSSPKTEKELDQYRYSLRSAVAAKYQGKSLADLDTEVLSSGKIPYKYVKIRSEIFEEWIAAHNNLVKRDPKPWFKSPTKDLLQKDRSADGYIQGTTTLVEVKSLEKERTPGIDESAQIQDYGTIIKEKVPWITKAADGGTEHRIFTKVRYLFNRAGVYAKWIEEMNNEIGEGRFEVVIPTSPEAAPEVLPPSPEKDDGGAKK